MLSLCSYNDTLASDCNELLVAPVATLKTALSPGGASASTVVSPVMLMMNP